MLEYNRNEQNNSSCTPIVGRRPCTFVNPKPDAVKCGRKFLKAVNDLKYLHLMEIP